ncbi:MAG TPA: hypothetical protein VH702_06435 [Vicinamibacterales bacterium]
MNHEGTTDSALRWQITTGTTDTNVPVRNQEGPDEPKGLEMNHEGTTDSPRRRQITTVTTDTNVPVRNHEGPDEHEGSGDEPRRHDGRRMDTTGATIGVRNPRRENCSSVSSVGLNVY